LHSQYPVFHPYDSIGKFCYPKVMGGHDDTLVQVPCVFVEKLYDLETLLGLQASRGLIGENEVRPVRKGSCQGNSLFFALAQCWRKSFRKTFNPKLLEQRLCPALRFSPCFPRKAENQVHIFRRRKRIDQKKRLEYKPDPPRSQLL
jgi:hypothetical protein